MILPSFLRFFVIFIISVTLNHAYADSTEKIVITGLSENMLQNAEERLKIIQTDESDKIIKEINAAVQPFGYFHATIQQTANNHYAVNLGAPLRVIKRDITIIGMGEKDSTIQKAIQRNSLLIPGKIFTTTNYNNLQNTLFRLSYNNGYIKAKMIRHEVYVNLEKNEASIFLTLDTGIRYYYGPITFSPSPYNTLFLKRFVPFQTGEVYSSQSIENVQSQLSSSKYFSTASVNPQVDDITNANQVPIMIDTQAVKAKQYNFGVGYGTNTGARTSVGMNLNRITDTGQSMSTMLNLSVVTTSITSKYYIPGKRPTMDQYVTGFYLGRFTPEAGTAYTRQLFTGYETKLNSTWSGALDLNYLHERFSIDNSDYQTADMLYPSVNLSRLTTDNPINPTNGSRQTLDTSVGALGTEQKFIKSELSGKWIYPPTKNNFVILRGDIGAIYASNYSENFPLSMRFFAGGFNSVRGYSYQSLGPGKYIKVGSAEIQQRVVDEFYVGVFVDEGNATDDLTQPLERGIGLDFVYRTSVGPISIDIAQANTDPDKPLSIEFNFGADL